jgi:hypothetical protein
MGAIAERLALALTATAPKVGFPGLNFYANGRITRSYWIGHKQFSCVLLK